jgi:hypothetical protein
MPAPLPAASDSGQRLKLHSFLRVFGGDQIVDFLEINSMGDSVFRQRARQFLA